MPPEPSPTAYRCSVVYVALLRVPDEPENRLYVGSASGALTTPDELGRYPCKWPDGPLRRYRDHKRGYKANRKVQRWGIGLLPELYEHLNPVDWWTGESLEKQLAKRLAKLGIGVYQG